MLDNLRSAAFAALESPLGNRLPPVRWAKGALLFLNHMAGQPLASREVLLERRSQRGSVSASTTIHTSVRPPDEPAPVMIYTDWNSRHDLKRITEVLVGAGIPWKELDCTEDESTRAWVKSSSGVDDLPAVFIAGDPIGGFQEVMQLEVSGELRRRVRG